MQRDFSIYFSTFDKTPIFQDEKPLTLQRVSINALMTPMEDEKNLSGEEKFARYKLASRINASSIVEVTAEEIAMLKKLIGNVYAPIIVGPAFEALETELAAN